MRRSLIVAAIALLAMPAAALAGNTTRGTADDDLIPGTAAADVIFARAGDDTVTADAGDDRVYGGQGADTLDGGVGNDLIHARGDGGDADTITCGDGEDTVRAGRNDEVADDCETVKQPGAAKTPAPDEEETVTPDKGPRFDEDGKPGKGPKAAAAQEPVPAPAETAKQACKTEKHDMGTQLFKKTYAAKSTSKAMQACMAKAEPAAEAVAENAAQDCKAERTADPALFAEKYGTNKNNKNAYGKCVSGKAQEATEEATEARVNAAKTCKTMRADDRAGFDAKYGTKKNAFGKCVSTTAKEDETA
jgi:Ca2+-binding RTX toxin-like protein